MNIYLATSLSYDKRQSMYNALKLLEIKVLKCMLLLNTLSKMLGTGLMMNEGGGGWVKKLHGDKPIYNSSLGRGVLELFNKLKLTV